MKQLPGFRYDAKLRTAFLDGYVPRTDGKVRRRKTVENVTRAGALEAWKAFRADLASGRAIDGPMTFGAFIAREYPKIDAALKPSTRRSQKTLLARHLLRCFEHTLLEAITTVAVIDFKTDLRERGLGAVYINNAVRLLKTLLRQAVERDAVAEYPIKKKIKKERETLLRLEFSPSERAAFLATFNDETAFHRHLDATRRTGPEITSAHFHAPRRFGGGMRGGSPAARAYFQRFRELREFFIVALETGLRNRSDLRSLRWGDVDFANEWIRVVMQKTEHEALIPMSRACRAALVACRARTPRSVYVFVNAAGTRWSVTRIRRTHALAKAIAGITRRARLHDLRHTFASRLASRNVSLQMIAEALGHTTTKMAERYARPSQEALRRITAALDTDNEDCVALVPAAEPYPQVAPAEDHR